MYIMVCHQSLYTATISFKVSSNHNREHVPNAAYLKCTAKLRNVQNLTIKLRIKNYLANLFHIFIASIKSFVVTYSHVKVLQPMLNLQSLT